MEEHKPASVMSGVVTCTCGFETTHAAHDDDMWAAYDEHLRSVNA